MPRYSYDPSKVTSSIEVFPADDYEFIIGEPKAFLKKNSKDEDSFGVRFALTVAEGDFRGKKTIYTCYMHSEGAQSMSKRFHMAAYGYAGREGEQQFNTDHGSDDWSFDPETGTCGDAWRAMAGSRVIGVLGVGKNNRTDEPQQDFKNWRPAITAKS